MWHPRSPLNGIKKYLTIITIVTASVAAAAAAAARMRSAVGTEFSRSSLFHQSGSLGIAGGGIKV